jgi:aldehyde:ferredoxin oxidoreductase
MNGWSGTILRVNLSTGTVSTQPTNLKDAVLYIGARGLGDKLYIDEVDARVDPLSPDNKIVFAPGPFSGTLAPSGGRYHVVTKGPLTDAIAGSNASGLFGPELRYAGYDALIVEGKAPEPVYLWIKDDVVEIRKAAHLWGKWVPETTEMIQAETDLDARVACIGPAGEKRVLFASIMNDVHSAAGRSGVGAVMGSKNLKAIAVYGTKPIKVAHPRAFREAILEARETGNRNSAGGAGLKAYGVDVPLDTLNEIGSLAANNFQQSYIPAAGKGDHLSASPSSPARPRGCYSCVMRCGRISKVKNPGYAIQIAEQAQEEGLSVAFDRGAFDHGIDNTAAMIQSNQICDEMGMDPISLGATVACAMEMFEAGIITVKDTDGLDLSFGNSAVMVDLTRKIGLRDGFGNKLAVGSYRFANSYGHPEFSMTVKKQEIPPYDPRGIQGIGLEYATCNRGGCHTKGYTVAVEVLGFGDSRDPHATADKPFWVKLFQDLTAAIDASGGCIFGTSGRGGENYAALLTALTGVTYSTEEYVKAGERIWNLERLFNLQAGFTSKDDQLPSRFTTSPISSGPAKGQISHVPEMLTAYYKLRGWDEDGVPTQERLRELQLG